MVVVNVCKKVFVGFLNHIYKVQIAHRSSVPKSELLTSFGVVWQKNLVEALYKRTQSRQEVHQAEKWRTLDYNPFWYLEDIKVCSSL